MATATTVYDVMVNYDVNGKGLETVGRVAGTAQRKTLGLMSTLTRLAVVAGGAFGMGKVVEHTIGFNRQLKQTEAQLRTIIGLNLGTDFATSGTLAVELLGRFREDAKASAGTFKDMAQFASAIAGPVTRAGGSLQDLREITKGAVVAAAAFGERADLAQLDITQALQGTLGAKDRFAKAVLGPMGISHLEFNKLSQGERLSTLKQAFGQKAIKEAAQAYQREFEGVFSTFRSNLEEIGGRIGKKTFDNLTTVLTQANEWLENNQHKVDQMITTFSDGMAAALKAGLKIFGWLSDNKQTLIFLAKAFAVGKVASFARDLFGGLIGSAGNLATAFQTIISGTGGKGGLMNFGSALGTVTTALAGLYVAAQAIATWVDQEQTKRIKETTESPLLRERALLLGGAKTGDKTRVAGLFEAETRISKSGFENFERARTSNFFGITKSIVREAQSAGFLDKEGKVNRARVFRQFDIDAQRIGRDAKTPLALAEALEAAQRSVFTEEKALAAQFLRGLQIAVENGLAPVQEVAKNAQMPDKASLATKAPKGNTTKVEKVIIQVETNDPDRLALATEGLFNDLAKNNAQAAYSMRGG